MEIVWVALAVSLLCSLYACWLAARAYRGSVERSPAKWNTQLAELRTELIEVQDLLEQVQKVLKKRGARAANSARWDRDEPDPKRDPEAWKAWANSGGLRQYLRK